MKHITQIAECCSTPYMRWRLPEREFPAGRLTCDKCGERLYWHAPEGGGAGSSLRRYYRNSRHWMMAGLSSRGKLRKRRWFRTELERHEAQAETRKRRLERYAAAGLTSRGQPRRKNWLERPVNPIEIAWRSFRDTFDKNNTMTVSSPSIELSIKQLAYAT